MSVYFRDVTSRVEAQREVERTTRRQQALIDFGRAALAGATYDETLADAIDLLRETLDASVVDLYHYDRLTKNFSIVRSVGWENGAAFDRDAAAARTHRDRRSHGRAVRLLGRAHRSARAHARATRSERCALRAWRRSIGTVHAPVGAIVAYSRQTRTFSVADVRFIQSLSQSIAEFATALESNRLMFEVLESIADAFVAVDRDLRMTYVNGRMARFWDEVPARIIGTRLRSYTARFDTPDGLVLQFFKDARHERRSFTFEHYWRDRWFEVRLYPFGLGVAAYVRDITKHKGEQERVLELNAELEARVAERTTQLELANKELESFSYSVSHDLRAPLRAIDGFSAALAEDYGESLDARARGYLDRVRRAAQRMADLIDSLLKLAKVARTPITFAQVDLSAIAQALAGELRESDPQRSVDVTVEAGLEAQGEPHLLQIVLANLLGNAWKFTRQLQHAQVHVGKNSEGEFYVRDNGAGFEMAYANKLFGAFARLHSIDEYEGTGIGLATVARIVHRHGGNIRGRRCCGRRRNVLLHASGARAVGSECDEQAVHSPR